MVISRRKTEEFGEKPASATLSTTNPTWTDLGANPSLRGKRPATKRVSHGRAFRGIIKGITYWSAQGTEENYEKTPYISTYRKNSHTWRLESFGIQHAV
jgi:hypothetical protein